MTRRLSQREITARLLACESDAELERVHRSFVPSDPPASRRARVAWERKIRRLLADPAATPGERAAARAALERIGG